MDEKAVVFMSELHRDRTVRFVTLTSEELSMQRLKATLAFVMSLFLVVPSSSFASSHREAPITALDHTADITDWYAFVSFDHPDR